MYSLKGVEEEEGVEVEVAERDADALRRVG